MMAAWQGNASAVRFTLLILTIGALFSIGAYAWFGWFGVMLVGLLGLWLTNHSRMVRADEEGDLVYADDPWQPVSKAVEEQGRRELERRLAIEGRSLAGIAAERARLRYLKNTALIALAMLGFVMMMVHG